MPLQSRGRLWIGKLKKSNTSGCASGSGDAETQAILPSLQSYGSNFASLWVK
jgi:hypothetical protein